MALSFDSAKLIVTTNTPAVGYVFSYSNDMVTYVFIYGGPNNYCSVANIGRGRKRIRLLPGGGLAEYLDITIP